MLLQIAHIIAYGMAFFAGSIFLLITWQMALDHVPGLQAAVTRFFRWKRNMTRRLRGFRLIREDIHVITLIVMGYGFYLLLWALENHGLTRY